MSNVCILKAMIFAAGLGTRLRPLTNDKPKALVEVDGKPLLEIVIRRLKYFGVKEIIINVHHFADLVIDFLKQHNYFDIKIAVSDERDLLLNTGGGLKKAARFFDDGAPFLVCNTDILSNINLSAFYDQHCQSKALATLAVRNRVTSRYLLFNEENQLVGWKNEKTGEIKASRNFEENEIRKLAFSGLHVIDPAIFKKMPNESVFSIIEVYLEAAKENSIIAYPHDESIWLDVGKIPSLKKAEKIIDKIEIN